MLPPVRMNLILLERHTLLRPPVCVAGGVRHPLLKYAGDPWIRALTKSAHRPPFPFCKNQNTTSSHLHKQTTTSIAISSHHHRHQRRRPPPSSSNDHVLQSDVSRVSTSKQTPPPNALHNSLLPKHINNNPNPTTPPTLSFPPPKSPPFPPRNRNPHPTNSLPIPPKRPLGLPRRHARRLGTVPTRIPSPPRQYR